MGDEYIWNDDWLLRIEAPSILDERRCLTCKEVLVRKEYPVPPSHSHRIGISGQRSLENPKHFAKRKYCGKKCARNDPNNSEKRRTQILGMVEIAATHPNRIAKLRSPEYRQNKSEQMTALWASGEMQGGPLIRRSRREGKSAILTDEQVRKIYVDTRPHQQIVHDYATYAHTVSGIKHNTMYTYVDRQGLKPFIRAVGSARVVLTPEGRFPSVTAAALHHGIGKTTVARWTENQRPGWRYDD
jgi:hypothetical protein